MEIFHNDKETIYKRESKRKKDNIQNEKEKTKMKIPKDIQKQMLEFFMKTSIPRKKRERAEKSHVLSENHKTDRSGENADKNGDLR